MRTHHNRRRPTQEMGLIMEIAVYKTLWGAVGAGTRHATFADAVAAIAAEDWPGLVYAPVLATFDPTLGTLDELREACDSHNLDLVLMIHTWANDLASCLEELASELMTAERYRPRHVVMQVGLDRFTPEETDTLLDRGREISNDLGIRVAHETHRHRPLFTPWVTRQVLERHPDIELSIDLSHWVVVMERLLDDDEALRLAAQRTIHLDARIGTEQGPQLADPFGEDSLRYREAYEQWWKIIAEEATRPSLDQLTVVPEYGPPPYQQPLPSDPRTPADALWETCEQQRQAVLAMFTD